MKRWYNSSKQGDKMSTLTKSEVNYIEHEVQLRLHTEQFKLNDKKYEEKFSSIDKRFDHLDNKLNWIIGIVLGSVFIPVALHFLKLL